MTAKRIYILIFISFIAVLGQVLPPMPACRAAQDKKAYIIGPRDVLSITIFAGGEKQQEVEVTVTASGTINVPFLGPTKAAGLSVSQLEQHIVKPLAENYFVSPEVNIIVVGYHSLRYFISGAVKNPGLYEMERPATLMELIARAGGLLPERGNVAYVLRGSTSEVEGGKAVKDILTHKKPIKVNLEDLLDKGDMTYNLPLKTGDVVYIPLRKVLDVASTKIYVGGKVKRPGLYDYQPGLTALSACIMAGGFDKFAAPNRTKIIRKEKGKQKVIEINLKEVMEGKTPDVELKPGDRVQVPESWL